MYISSMLDDRKGIEKKCSLSWTSDIYINSHLEGYSIANQEQELATKNLI